jgi:2,3-bisphosphoglycerate-independent phosphoglycerate mutase
MKPPGYGGTQPRLDDDRLPVVLVTLDGLGDRAIPQLGGQTPAEAAHTPVLDALTARGASGWHLPFGWGRAPASELAHWAMFGFSDIGFPGRAVLEGVGAGVDIPIEAAVTFAALRTSQVIDGEAWITGRAAAQDAADAEALWTQLAEVFDHSGARLASVGRGEAVLVFPHVADGAVTDSDPFFEDFHPWLRVRPISAAAAPFAEHLNQLLAAARDVLLRSEINTARVAAGRPALDVVTTKWSGTRNEIPSFVTHIGVAGAAVTSTRLYRGIAGVLDMPIRHVPPQPDHGADIAARIDTASELIADGARFVHVHTKATDEAGHTKHPTAKRDVLEALDTGLAGLHTLADHAVIAITGDHATPSVDGVLHTADPTPLLVVGPTVRPDPVTQFGERFAYHGWYRNVHADELLPLLFSHANRPVFLGHRLTPRQTVALPDTPEPMPLNSRFFAPLS